MSKCYFGCGRDLKPNSKLKSCQTCRNSMGAAIRKGAHWFKNRVDKLRLYLNRTENVQKSGKARVW